MNSVSPQMEPFKREQDVVGGGNRRMLTRFTVRDKTKKAHKDRAALSFRLKLCSGHPVLLLVPHSLGSSVGNIAFKEYYPGQTIF